MLSQCKSRSLDVQLAACLWYVVQSRYSTFLDVWATSATHITRASIAGLLGSDLSYSFPIVHALNRLIASTTESPANRTKACFILCTSPTSPCLCVFNELAVHLVTDNKELSRTALERGSAKDLALLVTTIMPAEIHPGWDQEESESVCCLREVRPTFLRYGPR